MRYAPLHELGTSSLPPDGFVGEKHRRLRGEEPRKVSSHPEGPPVNLTEKAGLEAHLLC